MYSTIPSLLYTLLHTVLKYINMEIHMNVGRDGMWILFTIIHQFIVALQELNLQRMKQIVKEKSFENYPRIVL